jgi:hypothetical protein
MPTLQTIALEMVDLALQHPVPNTVNLDAYTRVVRWDTRTGNHAESNALTITFTLNHATQQATVICKSKIERPSKNQVDAIMRSFDVPYGTERAEMQNGRGEQIVIMEWRPTFAIPAPPKELPQPLF